MAADKHVGKTSIAKVFYLKSSSHTFVHRLIWGLQSEGASLGDWLTSMVTDQEELWQNIRPDLHQDIPSVDPNDFYEAAGVNFSISEM